MTSDILISMETLNVRETLKYWWEKIEYLINHAGSASFTKTTSRCIKDPHVNIQMLKSLTCLKKMTK